MDVVEIVIAEIDLPIGRAPRAEIVVNGTPLTELVERAEGEPSGYAPLPPDELLPALRAARGRVQVLGCCCGVARCSWVEVTARGDETVVLWEQVRSSGGPVESVGPFRFDRARYEAALACPRTAAQPVREYES